MSNVQPQAAPLIATSAADFKLTRKPITLQLRTSGRFVTLQAVQLTRLMMLGKVPNQLTPMAASLIWGEYKSEKGEAPKTIQDLAMEMLLVMDWVVTLAMVEPRITDTGFEDDAIALTDLDPEELQEIYDLATHPAKMVRPFRNEQVVNVESVQDSEGGE